MPQKSRDIRRTVSFSAMTTENPKHIGPQLEERNPMIEPIKSVSNGTCALNGLHSDPAIAAECPVLRKRFRANQSSSEEGPAITLQGTQEGASSRPEKSSTSDTVFRYSRAGKSGRPRVALSEQRRKARERVRRYRDRQKKAVI
jgi:hypothetical protein